MTLLNDLAEIVGEKYVTTTDDSPQYKSDWTGKYQSAPLAIVRPANTEEVAQIVVWANDTKTPLVPVSGNTGLTGGTTADNAVMLSLDRLNTIKSINTADRTATVGAGVILSSLHDAAEAQDLVFPLTFGAKGSTMVGGFLSTNAGGSNVVKYGNTRDLVLGIEVVTPIGEIMNLMSALHKDNSGLNLKHLMIGAEGTLGIITAAILKLHPKPRAYATAMVATDGLDSALTLLNTLQLETGAAVEAFEYMSAKFIDQHKADFDTSGPFDDEHDTNILVEIGTTIPAQALVQDDGTLPVTTQLEETLVSLMERGQILDAIVAQNEAHRRAMWERRESAAEVSLGIIPNIDTDVAVPLDKVDAFLTAVTPRVQTVDAGATDVAIAHLGDGNIHYTVYPSSDDDTLKDRIRKVVEDVTQEFAGSFSAEHGIGISKLGSMKRRKDPAALASMRAIKFALDPHNILNPGKVIP